MQQRQNQKIIDKAISKNKINFNDQSFESLNVNLVMEDYYKAMSSATDSAIGKSAAAYRESDSPKRGLSLHRRKTFLAFWNENKS